MNKQIYFINKYIIVPIYIQVAKIRKMKDTVIMVIL